MKTTIFKLNYNDLTNEDIKNKETTIFLINNLLRFQFVLENKSQKLFHKYNEDINDSIIFLGKVYDDKVKLDIKQNKEIMEEIIFKVHKVLENLLSNEKINEELFTKWLKNKKNQ